MTDPTQRPEALLHHRRRGTRTTPSRRLAALPALPGLLAVLLASALACGTTPADSAPDGQAAAGSVAPGINERFLSPDVDVAEMVDLFEGESREIAVARDAIAATLQLSPGLAVADIGAGTGLFMAPLAGAVGLQGKVYAVDIAEAFVDHLRARAADEHFPQVEARLCGERSVGLPPASLDRAFVCDTYHHFEYPAEVLASLHRALRPGGLLVVVDFERIPGGSREWVLDHVRAGKDVFRAEIEAAGFLFVDEVPVAGLAENYLLRFRRP